MSGTKTLRFGGRSDDTFGLVDGSIDYDNCASCKPIVFKVIDEASPHVGCFVVGTYSAVPAGVWTIGIAQLDEDVLLPPWGIGFENNDNVPYSPILAITCPATVVVEHVKEERR